MNTEETFWNQVDKKGEDECWNWKGSSWNGYGKFSYRSRMWQAHQFSYYLATGIVSDSNSHVHHICNNKQCVNPKHLDLVDSSTNVWLSYEQECKRGHPRTEENTYYRPNGQSYGCKVCHRERAKYAREHRK